MENEIKVNEFGEYVYEIKNKRLREWGKKCVWGNKGFLTVSELQKNLRVCGEKILGIIFEESRWKTSEEKWESFFEEVEDVLRRIDLDTELEWSIRGDHFRVGNFDIKIIFKMNEKGKVVPFLVASKFE